jgi:putative transposase
VRGSGPSTPASYGREHPRPGDQWHLDEVLIKIRGVQKYLWRAVDQHGNVLDILIQGKRDEKAATRFFRGLLKHQGHPPRVLITDKLLRIWLHTAPACRPSSTGNRSI